MATTLVLVAGLMDTAKRMTYMSKQFQDLGWKVLTPSLRPSNGSERIEVLAEQLSCYIKENINSSERISLIGFSMGGLIGRYYLQRLDGLAITDKFITISTPHHGTVNAYLFAGIGVKQMRPKSDFLQNLNLDIAQLQQIDFASFYTPLDLIIIPAKSSVIKWGENYRVFSLFHPMMVFDKSVLMKMVIVLNNKNKE